MYSHVLAHELIKNCKVTLVSYFPVPIGLPGLKTTFSHQTKIRHFTSNQLVWTLCPDKNK